MALQCRNVALCAAAVKFLLPNVEETTELRLQISLGLAAGAEGVVSAWASLADILQQPNYVVSFNGELEASLFCADITR